MSWDKSWRIAADVDITGDDAIEITPSDDESKNDTTLVDAFDVVTNPGDGIGNARIDSKGAEECSRISNSSVVSTKEHTETDHADYGDAHVAQATLMGAISEPTNEDSQTGCDGVRWDCQQLGRGCVGVAHSSDNGWQEERERIQRHVAAHIDQHANPHLIILHCGPEIAHLELFMFGGGLLIGLQATDDTDAIDVREECGLVRKVVDCPEGSNAEEYCDDTFEDKDPCPTGSTAKSIHKIDCCSEKTTKGARHGSSREEDGLDWLASAGIERKGRTYSPDTEFGTSIPAGEIVGHAGEETSFSQT